MKYDAFISYRHLERDMYVAKKLHRQLETAKIPKKIQKQIGRKKINRVFRDQEELPIGSDLGSNIEAALQEAEFLIVICSPQTKDSYWVMKEIDTFISMHGRENVLAVLVDGEPEESFPQQILTDENGNPVEPLAADVRGDKKSVVKKKLKTESLRLAASILHVDYDDLKQRHRERKLHKIMAISLSVATVIVGLAVAFGLYNAYNLAKINEEYQQKLANESKVLAAQSLEVLENGDRQTAALLAMNGLPIDEERPFVPEAMYALSQALDCYDIGAEMRSDKLLSHNIQVSDFVEKNDGTKVISYDTTKTIYVWDIESGEKLYELPIGYSDYGFQDTIFEIGFSSEYAIVINSTGLHAYDDNGDEVYNVKGPEDDYISGGYIGVKQDIAILCSDRYVIYIDTSTGKEIKRYENHLEEDFGSHMVVDGDMKHMAVITSAISDEDPIYVSIFNLETDEYVDAPVYGNSVLDVKFTVDGALAISSITQDDLFSYETRTFCAQKINVDTGSELWRKDFVYNGSVQSSSYSYVASSYATIDGEECGRFIVNGTKDVHLLDLETGEEITTISSDNYIQKIGFNLDGSYIFVGTADGTVTLYPTDINKSVTDNVINVCKNSMMDFDIRSGYLVARTYRSPDLIIMKYSKDESMLYESELERRISSVPAISPRGDSYVAACSLGDADYSYSFTIIDATNGEVTGSFSVPNADYNNARYADENTIVVPSSRGSIYTYDIKKDKLDSEKYVDGYTAECHYSQNGEYLLFTYSNQFFVISMSDQKVVNQGENSIASFSDPVITNDGKTIYYLNISGNHSVEKYDVEKNKGEQLITDYRCEILRISSDGKQMATVSNDGHLRVYDIETMECTDDTSFYATSYTGLVQFSEDNTKLYLQGADLYFRIYDLENDQYVLKFANQTNEYDYCEFDAENNRLIVSNFVGMSIIDLESMGELSYVEHGRVFIPESQTIICANSNDVCAFKFKNMDELISEAQKLYGDKELTDLQKLEYQID